MSLYDDPIKEKKIKMKCSDTEFRSATSLQNNGIITRQSKSDEENLDKDESIFDIFQALEVLKHEREAFLSQQKTEIVELQPTSNEAANLQMFEESSFVNSRLNQGIDSLNSEIVDFKERLNRLVDVFDKLKGYMKEECGNGYVIFDFLWNYTLELYLHDQFEALTKPLQLLESIERISNIPIFELVGIRFFIALKRSEGKAWIDPTKLPGDAHSSKPTDNISNLDSMTTFAVWLRKYKGNSDRIVIEIQLLNIMLLLHENKCNEAYELIKQLLDENKKNILFLILRGDALKLLDNETQAIKSYSRAMTLARRENCLSEVQKLIGKGFKPGSWEWKLHFMNCIQLFLPKLWPFSSTLEKKLKERKQASKEELWLYIRKALGMNESKSIEIPPPENKSISSKPSPLTPPNIVNKSINSPCSDQSNELRRRHFERLYDRPWTREWKPKRTLKTHIITYSLDYKNVKRKYERPWASNHYDVISQRLKEEELLHSTKNGTDTSFLSTSPTTKCSSRSSLNRKPKVVNNLKLFSDVRHSLDTLASSAAPRKNTKKYSKKDILEFSTQDRSIARSRNQNSHMDKQQKNTGTQDTVAINNFVPNTIFPSSESITSDLIEDRQKKSNNLNSQVINRPKSTRLQLFESRSKFPKLKNSLEPMNIKNLSKTSRKRMSVDGRRSQPQKLSPMEHRDIKTAPTRMRPNKDRDSKVTSNPDTHISELKETTTPRVQSKKTRSRKKFDKLEALGQLPKVTIELGNDTPPLIIEKSSTSPNIQEKIKGKRNSRKISQSHSKKEFRRNRKITARKKKRPKEPKCTKFTVEETPIDLVNVEDNLTPDARAIIRLAMEDNVQCNITQEEIKNNTTRQTTTICIE